MISGAKILKELKKLKLPIIIKGAEDLWDKDRIQNSLKGNW